VKSGEKRVFGNLKLIEESKDFEMRYKEIRIENSKLLSIHDYKIR